MPVGPGGRIELAVANHFDDAAVALGAAHGSRRRALFVLAEHVVQRAEDLSRLRVMAGLEFLSLLGVAGAARLRRDDDGNPLAEVLETVRTLLVRLMALIASDAGLRMRLLAHCCTARGAAPLRWQSMQAWLSLEVSAARFATSADSWAEA